MVKIGYPSMSMLSHFLEHATLTWMKRTLGDRILHHVLNKEMRPSLKSCPSHPRPQRWCSLSFPVLRHGHKCTTGDEASASSHRHGEMGKLDHQLQPLVAVLDCCCCVCQATPYMTATCLSSFLGREVVNLSLAQITESIQEHLPWFEDFSWCIFVFLWNKSILSPGGLFPKTIKKEVFQWSVLFIFILLYFDCIKAMTEKKSLNYVLLELRIKTQHFSYASHSGWVSTLLPLPLSYPLIIWRCRRSHCSSFLQQLCLPRSQEWPQ